MMKWMLAAGAAALAITRPLAAERGGDKGGGRIMPPMPRSRPRRRPESPRPARRRRPPGPGPSRRRKSSRRSRHR